MRSLLRILGTVGHQVDTGVHRLRLGSVVAGNGQGLLIDNRLLRTKPIVERAWSRRGFSIVDAATAALRIDDGHPFLTPRPSLPDQLLQSSAARELVGHGQPGLADDVGHVTAEGLRAPVAGLLWQKYDTAPAPTRAQVVHAFATCLTDGTPTERSRVAHLLATNLPVVLVAAFDGESLLDAATGLLSA